MDQTLDSSDFNQEPTNSKLELVDSTSKTTKRVKFLDQVFKRNISDIDNSMQENNIQYKEWTSYSRNEKTTFIFNSFLKILIFIALLYLFLLSLNFMSIGFSMVSKYALGASETIRFILSNPFAALAIGIITTAIIQNSTATTSIAVSMVGAGIIPSVKSAIPIIMGSNIGTCITNSLIALTLSADPNEFKRAFSAATLNDIFNFLTTFTLLPIEIFSDFLFKASEKITNSILFENKEQINKARFMTLLLDPVIDLFIVLNETAVDELSRGNRNITRVSLNCCKPISNHKTNQMIPLKIIKRSSSERCVDCNYLCFPIIEKIGEGFTGLFWIIVSLVFLIVCLFSIVKVLSLLIVGPIAKGVRTAINGSFPGYFKWLTSIVLFLFPLLLTLIVQSSNIITATLVPLCGIGMINLHRVYIMTLGSNIGTTVTGLITAFTQPPSSIKKALQLALVHTLFNIIGVLLWLPLPILRLPKRYAKKLGNAVFKYKWFLYAYVSAAYFILPSIVFGLALIPYWIGLATFGIPILVSLAFFIILKIIIFIFNDSFTNEFKSYTWLPIWLKSLKPYDEFLKKTESKYKRFFDKISKSKKNYLSFDDDCKLDTKLSTGPVVSAIRKMSAINSLINEAKLYKEMHGASNYDSSSDEEENDENQSIDFYVDRRKSCHF